MPSATRTSDAVFALVSILYHALQGAELYERCASDAERDQDLVAFFREVQQQERR